MVRPAVRRPAAPAPECPPGCSLFEEGYESPIDCRYYAGDCELVDAGGGLGGGGESGGSDGGVGGESAWGFCPGTDSACNSSGIAASTATYSPPHVSRPAGPRLAMQPSSRPGLRPAAPTVKDSSDLNCGVARRIRRARRRDGLSSDRALADLPELAGFGVAEGFNLHAGGSLGPLDREGWERLPPFRAAVVACAGAPSPTSSHAPSLDLDRRHVANRGDPRLWSHP